MKIDPLTQYAKLKQQLSDEKARIEARLQEINQVLGGESDFSSRAKTTPAQIAPRAGLRRRGRRAGGNTLSMREAVMQALAREPVARKDLVAAVEAVGYRFTTKNPLNSLGSVLYAKNTPIKSKDGRFYVEGAAPASDPLPRRGNGLAAETEPAPARRKRRRLSPEGRARIAAAAKARWDRVRAGK